LGELKKDCLERNRAQTGLQNRAKTLLFFQPYIDQNVYNYEQYQMQATGGSNGMYGRGGGRGGSAIGQRTSRGGVGMSGGRPLIDPRNGGPYVARRGGDGSRATHPPERGKRKKDDEAGDNAAGNDDVHSTREHRRGGG
jgi:hypothetical protein